MNKLLKDIQKPEQIKQFSIRELESLAEEIRTELIQTVSENGGHLASNLGIVELTLALHYVFDCPTDQFVFDVGHQSYVHKLLTGRYRNFRSLRKKDGLCGFPDPEESVYDSFPSGHASNALSAALGMIRADHTNHVITILGDGALSGGMCYEALNDAGQSKIPMIVILNDNEMSISKNVGAMSFYLDHIRQTGGYKKAKQGTRSFMERIPLIGKPLIHIIEKVHDSVKALFIDGSFFEALGFNYFGPVDGHDLKKLIQVLQRAKETRNPLLVHVVTQKGKGYKPAEAEPTNFHGTAPFFIDSGIVRKRSKGKSNGQTVASVLAELADQDPTINVICAAMVTGTGMEDFQQKHPDRFFDVGIAEEHAVSMAAGMASRGMHPYVAIYSTFLQRCYDQIMIDVCRNKLPVVFLADHSGLAGADGKTHQGIYDIAFLRTIPDLIIMSARDTSMLKRMVRCSRVLNQPSAVLYSKETLDLGPGFDSDIDLKIGKWEELVPGNDVLIIAEGPSVNVALQVSVQLGGSGISCGVTDACFCKPIDEEYIKQISDDSRSLIITLEESPSDTGIGSAIATALAKYRYHGRLITIGTPDSFIPHATISEQRKMCGLDAESISALIRKELCKELQ